MMMYKLKKNKKILLTSIFVFMLGFIGFMSANINQDNLVSTTVSDGGIGGITINKTITITNTTTLPAQVITFTTTLLDESISYVTTTLPPNIVTITSTTTTIIQPQTIINEVTTKNYILNTTTTKTVTTNVTQTKTKEWSISGATISQPDIVESITFTFTSYDRSLQIGSYITFLPDYVTVVRAVKNQNNIPNITSTVTIGNALIDNKLYQYSMFSYRDTVTNKLHYVIIATYFYPDYLRTYYIFYESSGVNTIAEMKEYLGAFKIGV